MKKQEGIQGGKIEVKLYLFEEDVVIYVENVMVATKKLIELIHKVIIIAEYKIDIKMKCILYTSNNQKLNTI